MGPVVSMILLVCAVVLMFTVSRLMDRRGNHTNASLCIVLAIVCLIFSSLMALVVFK